MRRALILSWAFLPCIAAQTPAGQGRIAVVVLEGQGAINNVRLHRAKDPVVGVVDENNAPVRGASVTFLLPDTGPSAEFGTGARLLAVLTDSRGQAVGRGMIPNAILGKYEIRVVASYRGETANAVINQTNAEPGGAVDKIPSKKFWLIALIGGAAAGGIALAAGGHGGSGSSSTPAAVVASGPGAIVISAGTPGFQPPH